MTSFTNTTKTNHALTPGGIARVLVAGGFSQTATYASNRFAGESCGVETPVRSGGTAKRSSARIASWQIGVSASSRGAGRSLRNFSVDKQEEISIQEKDSPGGVSF
jgi:hypothetical protein